MEINEKNEDIVNAPVDASEPAPTATKGEMRCTFSRIALGLCLSLLASQLIPVALGLIPNFDLKAHSFLVGALCTGCFTLPLMLLLTRRMPAKKAEKSSLSVGGFLALVSISYACMILGNLIGIGINTLFSPGSIELVSNLATSIGSPLEMLLAFVVLAPVFEELVFRNILVDRVLPYGEWPAILFSGLTFGLFHGNLTQFFYAFLLGMVLSYVYIRTGKILYTIGIHACLNCMGGLLPVLFPPITYILLLVALVGLVLFFVLKDRIHVQRNVMPGAGAAMFSNAGMILLLLLSGFLMALVAIVMNHPELTSLL